jgi:hypothetical protein
MIKHSNGSIVEVLSQSNVFASPGPRARAMEWVESLEHGGSGCQLHALHELHPAVHEMSPQTP